MEVPRGLGQEGDFLCALNSANRYLTNLDISTKTKLTESELTKWTDVRNLTEALNTKVSTYANEIFKQHGAIIYQEAYINNTKQSTLMKVLSGLTNTSQIKTKLENGSLNQFIILRDTHYTVYEKNKEGKWQEWNEGKISPISDANTSKDALINALFKTQGAGSFVLII